MKRQIVLKISPEGVVVVEVKGHAGPGCRDLTRELEAALGLTLGDRTTAEYHQKESQLQRRGLNH